MSEMCHGSIVLPADGLLSMSVLNGSRTFSRFVHNHSVRDIHSPFADQEALLQWFAVFQPFE